MISALVLQTQDDCQPGLLGDWSASRGVELDVLRVDRWRELPHPSNYSFAVLLGSDESFAGALTDWVLRVLDWIRSADAAGLPVLGIGFGAQALAAALGGSITRLATPELAWIELRVSDAEQVPAGPWLALHDETIKLPPLARELARNEFGPPGVCNRTPPRRPVSPRSHTGDPRSLARRQRCARARGRSRRRARAMSCGGRRSV
jgi:GMP synthase-like glutamine amidotransferase